MVVILEMGEFNTDFHPMVDFIAASPLTYALTVKPTIFVSHIRQFWSTARIEITDEGTHILATVDGIQRTMSEASLRRNIKLRDEDGIVFIPDTELFENLTLMGYNISQNQKLTFQKGDDSQGEACPTISGLEAEQDRENIIKTSTLPHDSPPRVTSFTADEGTQDLEIISLKARIKMFEDKDGGVVEPSREDATIKGKSLETEEEAGVDKRGTLTTCTPSLVRIFATSREVRTLTSYSVSLLPLFVLLSTPASSSVSKLFPFIVASSPDGSTTHPSLSSNILILAFKLMISKS
nr:hypothetical protein [Tanacetum cinerariifolium]